MGSSLSIHRRVVEAVRPAGPTALVEDPVTRDAPAGEAPGTMPLLSVRGLVASFDGTPVLGPVDLDVKSGQFVVVVGESGCGKTTLLNCIGGHVTPTHGETRFEGRRVTGPLPSIGTVFQRPNLFPWLSVLDNTALGLRLRGVAKSERDAEARRTLEMVGLADVATRRPYELSGGMQQRVALARALTVRPSLLLMDEPLGALDAITRERMQREIRQIWHRTHTTIVFITHDVDEAMYLGERVAVIGGSPGRIHEIVDTSNVEATDAGVVDTTEDSAPGKRARILREIESGSKQGERSDSSPRPSQARRRRGRLVTKRGLQALGLSLIVPAAAFLLWLILVKVEAVSPTFLPSPATVFDTGREIFSEGYRGATIWSHTWTSLSNVLIAFSIVTVAGVTLGWFMGFSQRVQWLFDPMVEFLRPLPPLAYLTLLVIWLGVGATTQITLLIICGFPLVTAAARSAALSVPMELRKTASAFGASRLQEFRHVLVPASIPEVLTGLRVTMGILFATVIAAEMVAARGGIGWMILDASRFLRADVIFVGIFVMVLLGFAIDRVFRGIERVAVPWRGRM
jgi:ABC-type nitrate/sulfonate/bicarbonate transport system ATPase subunit/ABC-type nitrate/sulfonate/bicarbonate transport system permease component